MSFIPSCARLSLPDDNTIGCLCRSHRLQSQSNLDKCSPLLARLTITAPNCVTRNRTQLTYVCKDAVRTEQCTRLQFTTNAQPSAHLSTWRSCRVHCGTVHRLACAIVHIRLRRAGELSNPTF
jgi:hypothetical protein